MNPPGQQRIVREVETRHDVRGAERDLLRLGEEIVGVAVQDHPADRSQRRQLLGHELGRIEHVEAQLLGLLLGKHLEIQLVLGERPGLDRLPQIAPMKVRIRTRDFHRLVPVERVRSGDGLPVELDEGRLALGVDQPERVNSEALHHAKAARQGAIRHRPHQHVSRLGHQGDEVPEGVVRRRGLRHSEMGLRLRGVDQIGKLHRVLDEEHRDVVAHEVPVPLVGVELHGEPANVTRRVGRAAFPDDRREADEDRRAFAGLGEERGPRHPVIGS